MALKKGATFCKLSLVQAFFSATFPSCPFYIYENIFHFIPAIGKDCTDSKHRLRIFDMCSDQPKK